MKDHEKHSPTRSVALGGSANAPCPKCGRPIAYFSGEGFISEVKTFASDSLVSLHVLWTVNSRCEREIFKTLLRARIFVVSSGAV
jgi:hypothetical protein